MKQAWVTIIPWDSTLALAALEAGADAVVLERGDAERMRALGVMRVVAPDGDLKLGEEVVRLEITSKADEERAAAVPQGRMVILALRDWRVIPLENLIAQRRGLMVEVASADDARLVLQTLEKGADGVVTTTRSAAEVRRIVALVHELMPTLALEKATVTEVKPLGMGDRVCVDTTTQMELGEGMLVGNTTTGFFLVHAESVENPYVASRPFRVNAGAVHAYLLAPGERTRYLSELRAGDEVLIVNHAGQTRVGHVGRCKVERRPLLMVRAALAPVAEGQRTEVGIVLQNAETIRLTRLDGQPVSIAVIKPGDEVLGYRLGGGRHFGLKVDETIREY